MKKEKNFFTYIILIVLILLISLPLISMVGTSFKSGTAALSDIGLIPKNPSLDNYIHVANNTTFLRNILNSIIISLSVTVACTVAASFAGYSLSRFKGKAFGIYKALLYLIQMVPLVLLLIPMFVIIQKIGLYDKMIAVIIAHTAINLPICIWMLKGFYDTIPQSIEEAAFIDGCSRFKSFYKIVLRLSTPGITSVAIMSFIYSWNEFMIASIFIRTADISTLTVGLNQFTGQYGSDWGVLMAASSMATIPAVIVLIIAQKYIVQGLTAGAVKG